MRARGCHVYRQHFRILQKPDSKRKASLTHQERSLCHPTMLNMQNQSGTHNLAPPTSQFNCAIKGARIALCTFSTFGTCYFPATSRNYRSSEAVILGSSRSFVYTRGRAFLIVVFVVLRQPFPFLVLTHP